MVMVEGDFGLFGVFDGHGPYGHDVSDVARQYLMKDLVVRLKLDSDRRGVDPAAALEDSFLACQAHLTALNTLEDCHVQIDQTSTHTAQTTCEVINVVRFRFSCSDFLLESQAGFKFVSCGVRQSSESSCFGGPEDRLCASVGKNIMTSRGDWIYFHPSWSDLGVDIHLTRTEPSIRTTVVPRARWHSQITQARQSRSHMLVTAEVSLEHGSEVVVRGVCVKSFLMSSVDQRCQRLQCARAYSRPQTKFGEGTVPHRKRASSWSSGLRRILQPPCFCPEWCLSRPEHVQGSRRHPCTQRCGIVGHLASSGLVHQVWGFCPVCFSTLKHCPAVLVLAPWESDQTFL